MMVIVLINCLLVFCHGPRDMFESSEPNSCNAKEGNPFGPFWNAFGIDFDGSEFYGPLSYTESDRSAWRSRSVGGVSV